MSKFLPKDFDPSRPLVLIAGRDTYPALLAERAIKAGAVVRLVELKGETSLELVDSFASEERVTAKVGQVGFRWNQLVRQKVCKMIDILTPSDPQN